MLNLFKGVLGVVPRDSQAELSPRLTTTEKTIQTYHILIDVALQTSDQGLERPIFWTLDELRRAVDSGVADADIEPLSAILSRSAVRILRGWSEDVFQSSTLIQDNSVLVEGVESKWIFHVVAGVDHS